MTRTESMDLTALSLDWTLDGVEIIDLQFAEPDAADEADRLASLTDAERLDYTHGS